MVPLGLAGAELCFDTGLGCQQGIQLRFQVGFAGAKGLEFGITVLNLCFQLDPTGTQLIGVGLGNRQLFGQITDLQVVLGSLRFELGLTVLKYLKITHQG